MSRPSTTPVVRRAAIAEAGLLAELATKTFYNTYAAENKPEDLRAYAAVAFSTEKLRAELADARNIFLVAEVDGALVGYAQLLVGETPASVSGSVPVELARLYASQEWHGRGVGEALMRVCVEEALLAGYRTMWLGVWKPNIRAQAFYRKWDFAVVGERAFWPGSDILTDWIMERRLC
jgi:ribosomal protein S18 acetylase RimI-like enzyme